MFYFKDFTEENYRKLIKLAKQQYEFIFYTDLARDGKKLLWRHDLDFSVQRAFRLAQIEKEEGVCSTYFIHLHNEFYNLLEHDISQKVKKIKDMGHEIALHFDLSYYGNIKTLEQLEEYLYLEKRFIEDVFNINCKAFSFHNPDTFNYKVFNHMEIAGMINTYSSYLQDNYGYISDSNGYWRFERLQDVLVSQKYYNLHVLTHPGWWTSEPMSPRDRISRCIDGRAKAQHQRYDELLERMGRKNIR